MERTDRMEIYTIISKIEEMLDNQNIRRVIKGNRNHYVLKDLILLLLDDRTDRNYNKVRFALCNHFPEYDEYISTVRVYDGSRDMEVLEVAPFEILHCLSPFMKGERFEEVNDMMIEITQIHIDYGYWDLDESVLLSMPNKDMCSIKKCLSKANCSFIHHKG